MRIITGIAMLCCLVLSARGQTNGPASAPSATEKAEQIVRRAVEALGGEKYLAIRSLIGRGLYTPFQDGISGVPSAFIDYLVYPDRERTEFRTQGIRIIQVNDGQKGWIYDGAAQTIKEMKPAQIEDFNLARRTSLENLLRGWWRQEGATLEYAGRREAGLAQRNETVRLTYPDGLAVEFEFGAKDNLPAKVIYKRKKADSEEVTEEDRFAQYVTIEGVVVPFIIDHFRQGVQTSRINYESLEINRPIADALFAKPASIKELKK
jgi:hypothetical protein